MLYISTRDTSSTFTSHFALSCASAQDGGAMIPLHIAPYTPGEIAHMEQKSFCQVVADVLNLFFSVRLSAWDVELCIGKAPARIHTMNHRILLCELWHNPAGDLSYIETALYDRISGDKIQIFDSAWVRIAVKIAVLFGLYGQLIRGASIVPEDTFDIVAPADDFIAPVAAWYARYMGLPIGNIICVSKDESSVWEFIHRGTFSGSNVSNALLLGIERLINMTLGEDEVKRFCACLHASRAYSLDEEQQAILSSGMYCSVTGANRASAVINSVFRSNGYIADPKTALCLGGLQDYRSGTGSTQQALLIAESSPINFKEEISAATGLSDEKISEHVKI